MGDREPYVFHISVNASILEHIRLVDTPGFNAPPPNSHDTKVTENAITEADALFVLVDTRKGNPTDSLLKQLDRLQQRTEDEYSPPMFLLLNKAEELPPTQRTEVKSECKTRNGDRFRDVTLISALQLNGSDDAAPFDALQTATRQIRDAIMRRDPFKALISAKICAETGTAIYRMDINGNVYEAPASLDSGLASREQLYEMVRTVSAERHVLLERQFQRKTSQLRGEWQQTISELDKVLKKELRESRGVGNGTDNIKSKALEAIDNAKSDIIDCILEISKDATDQDEIIIKGHRMEKRFLFEHTVYLIDLRLDRVHSIAADHDHWDRISDRYKNLLSFLKGLTDISSLPSQSKFAGKLQKECLKVIRDLQNSLKEEAENNQWWEILEKYHLRKEYQDDERARNADYDSISVRLVGFIPALTLDLTQFIQVEIDRLQEAVISSVGRNLSQNQERAGELDKLQQRINELREHTP